MNNKSFHYDIFISYAREELEWVQKNLYEPLSRCRTWDGRSPRIFFDIGEEGISIGANWTEALARALESSRKFVPVYSTIYFSKPMCKWELHQAFTRDPIGDLRILCPIMKDNNAEKIVPKQVSLINYWKITSPDWFDRLCLALELEKITERLTLQFLDEPPTEVIVNRTLPPVRVQLASETNTRIGEADISLRATEGLLGGNLVQTTVNSIATFRDLSFESPAKKTNIIAESDRCDVIYSSSFAVMPEPPTINLQSANEPLISLEKRDVDEALPVFFPGGQSLAIITKRRVKVYDSILESPSTAKCTIDLEGPIRFWRRGENVITLADWYGRIYALWDDNSFSIWELDTDASRFTVPGDISFDDNVVYVGMWNGKVYKLVRDEKAIPVLRHRTGVRALAFHRQRLYLCGFDGQLDVYENGRRVNGNALESSIPLLQTCGDVLVAVGEQKLYQIRMRPFTIASENSPLENHHAIFGDVARPVVIDTTGKGICFDKELTVRGNFHTTKGAIPISADHDGIWRTFYNPDGSSTLMERDRIVFGKQSGFLSVSLEGKLFAVGDVTGIRILSEAQMRALF